MKSLIIIPAFNECQNIENVVNSLLTTHGEMEYVVVNDCSSDETEQILRRMNANYISLPVNLGIGGSVQTGYKYAKENGYDIAIQLDGDGQHDAQYIKKLINPLLDGHADITIGSRFINNEGFQSSFARRMGINLLSHLIKLCCGIKVKDVTSGFRAVNKKMIKIFAEEYAQDYPEPEAIITAAFYGARIEEIPVIMNDRVGGQSSISQFKSVYYMIKVSLAIILKRCFERRKG